MASLIPTHPALQHEIEEQFGELQIEIVHCELCGDYHPPELHLTRYSAFEDDEPAEA
jgi:hypothetical protein